MSEGDSFWPDVRDKPAFLRRLMVELAGDARMSLEGDLSRCRFVDDIVLSRDETEALKRNTILPQLDFVVLQLTQDTIDPIFGQIAGDINRAIVHVQIERNGVIELGAYDNFHAECVMTGPGITSELLEELRNTNTIRSFTRPKLSP